jgi:hypothetical protein
MNLGGGFVEGLVIFQGFLLLLCVSFAAQLEDEIKLQDGQRGWRI